MSLKRTLQVAGLALALMASMTSAASAAPKEQSHKNPINTSSIEEATSSALQDDSWIIWKPVVEQETPEVQADSSEEGWWDWIVRKAGEAVDYISDEVIGHKTAGTTATEALCASGRFDPEYCEGIGDNNYWDPGDGSCDDPFILC